MAITAPALDEALHAARGAATLPADVLALVDELARLRVERRELVDARGRDRFGGYADRPQPERGEPTADFERRQRAYWVDKDAIEAALLANTKRREAALFSLRRRAGADGELPAAVAAGERDLLDVAAEHLDMLQRFAPNYAERDILGSGSPKQMQAWRALVALDETRYQPLRWARYALVAHTRDLPPGQTYRRAQRDVPATLFGFASAELATL